MTEKPIGWMNFCTCTAWGDLRILVIGSSNPGIGAQGWLLIPRLLFETRRQNFSSSLVRAKRLCLVRIQVKLPSCFVVRGLLCSARHLSVLMFACFYACVFVAFWICCLLFFGVDKVLPKLKRRYHTRLEKVKEYLETVKDFDKLISPQSLFFHFLGPNPSNKVRKNIETVKKSKHTSDIYFLSLFFFLGIVSSFLFQEWWLSLARQNSSKPKRRNPRVAC